MKDGSVVIAEKQISIKDETAPTVTIGNSSSTTNSISITVTATDGKETVQSATKSVRTYCPGTGLICNGPFTTTTTCSSCSGTGTSSSGYHVAKFRQTPTASYTEGRRCYACGSYAKGRTNAITCANCNSKFGIHLCTSCETKLISGQSLTLLYYNDAGCSSAVCTKCSRNRKSNSICSMFTWTNIITCLLFTWIY